MVDKPTTLQGYVSLNFVFLCRCVQMYARKILIFSGWRITFIFYYWPSWTIDFHCQPFKPCPDRRNYHEDHCPGTNCSSFVLEHDLVNQYDGCHDGCNRMRPVLNTLFENNMKSDQLFFIVIQGVFIDPEQLVINDHSDHCDDKVLCTQS